MFTRASCVVRTGLVRRALCPRRDAHHTFFGELRQPSAQRRFRDRYAGQDVLLLHGLTRCQKVEDHLSVRRALHGRMSSSGSVCARTQSSVVVRHMFRRRAQFRWCSMVLGDRCCLLATCTALAPLESCNTMRSSSRVRIKPRGPRPRGRVCGTGAPSRSFQVG